MALVLVVEAREADGGGLTDRLAARGYYAAHAATADAALNLLSYEDYDALVIDEYPPEVDGVAMLRLLRGGTRWRRLPVVLVTSDPDVDELTELLSSLHPVEMISGLALPARVVQALEGLGVPAIDSSNQAGSR